MPSQKFVLAGGCLLSFGAAFANTVVVLRTGASVSHLTGDVTRLSLDLVRDSPEVATDIVNVATAAGAFLAGAFLAGLLIHHPQLDLARPYGRTVLGIGGLFTVAHFLLPRHPVAAIGLAAFACGLQNALASRYRGVILRTTHLTGLITDFGIHVGMRARGFEIPRWKILMPALIALSFFAGGLISCLAVVRGNLPGLLLAGCGYIAAGLGWTLYKHVFMRAAPAPSAATDVAREQ